MKNSVFGDIELENNLVIIGPSYIKKEILEACSLKYNINFFDTDSLKERYLYKYKEDVLVYIDNKYNLLPEVGKIILNNLYEVDIEKKYASKKLMYLVDIKKDLINKGYIIYDKAFIKYLNGKKILVLNDEFNSLTKKMIDQISLTNNVVFIKEQYHLKNELDIYEHENVENEVISLASNITRLINNGIKIDNIKICKLDSIYKSSVNKIFNFYNIPFVIDSGNKLYYLEDIKAFLNNLDDSTEIISINDILEKNKMEDNIKEKLVSIINKFTKYKYVGEIKEELFYELKNSSINFSNYTNVVTEIDYKKYIPKSDEYIFMLGFNQDKIPVIHKDDQYLSDIEKNELSSDNSYTKNLFEANDLLRFINNTNNLFISYSLDSNMKELSPSSFIKKLEDNISIKIIKDSYDYKNEKLNKIILASRLDNYIKYNEVSEDLENLYSSYSDLSYSSYNNDYKKIDYNIIKEKLNNKINLSFSNTNTFFRCKFRFLLDTIYKLAPFEETVSQKIGNLFHEVLCIIYKDKLEDYDTIISNVVDKLYNNPSKKDLYYIERYKQALKKLITILNEELEKTSYNNTYFEEWFSIDKTNDLEINIVGKIDKILTLKDDVNTYVIVVDYKTGALHNDFNKVIYGLDMQLLYYLYLIKNSSKISNPKFTGMYLQSIMTDVLSSQKNKVYDDLVADNMRLNGYTTSDLKRLYEIDKGYEENSFIRGLKVKNDGTFYAYSKVLDDDTINSLIEIVDNNLKEVIHSIKICDFTINPKKIGDTIVGCEYCPFGDICYKNNNNIVELKEYKNLEFLGGDNDDTN